jgi:hypothetical protein
MAIAPATAIATTAKGALATAARAPMTMPPTSWTTCVSGALIASAGEDPMG